MPVIRIIGILALLALIPSWLGLLGGWHWALDLFAHFRWQYLIVSAVVVAWAAWRRQRRLLLLAALTLVLNAILVGRLAWHPELSRAGVADNFALQVLSLNVLTSNPDKPAVLASLMVSGADVIVLLEVDQKWMDALAVLQTAYPHRIAQPRADNFGIAVFSRLPWVSAEVITPGDAVLPSIEVRMTHQGHEFVLIGTHPLPPVGDRNAGFRDTQLRQLAEHVAGLQMPVLVVGDLNATPWSAGMRIATAKRLGFRSMSPPWTPTWWVRSIFAIPIDHALATAPLVVTRRWIGPDVGSDHRPLNVAVGWARD